MKNRVRNWIKSHKFATAIIVCSIQAFAVHALHKWYIGIPWLIADWNPGDFLVYIASFEAFIGTVFLGLVSLDQSKKADEANRRLSEENIYLQKIMSQKLIPVIQICSPKSVPIAEGYRTLYDFPSPQSFARRKQYLHSIGYEYIVNIDVEGNEQIHKKELSFSIENISESVIRHFCIDGIVIQGYKNIFLPITCINQQPGDGISALLKAGDRLKIQITFYFDDDKIREAWSHSLGGLAITLYTTNTTIMGVKFHEYMEISITSTEIADISYGEKTFDARREDNA